jgi:hypothetical protein
MLIFYSENVIFYSNMLIFYSENVISIVFLYVLPEGKTNHRNSPGSGLDLSAGAGVCGSAMPAGSSLEATLFPIFIEKNDGE